MKSSMWRQGIALGPCLVVFSSWHTTHPSKYHCSFIYYCCMVPKKKKNSRRGAFWSCPGHAKMRFGKGWSRTTCQNIIWTNTAVWSTALSNVLMGIWDVFNCLWKQAIILVYILGLNLAKFLLSKLSNLLA